MSPTAAYAEAALPKRRDELGPRAIVLLVLVQGERRDLEYSLMWTGRLTDAEHARRDRVLSWLCRCRLLESGAPHFCLTRRGHLALKALRTLGQTEPPADQRRRPTSRRSAKAPKIAEPKTTYASRESRVPYR